ncbi:MAG: hypothetical protein CL424_00155 [Acidimicrobiaceae bacterium]|nr:hypothetical protein [Acidimicrobiaceae bacterium]
MARRSGSNASQRKSSPLGSLDPAERGVVLDRLLIVHPELHGDAERLATDLLVAVSVERVASEVEAALVWISLDALAARSGRMLGRGYVHESEAAWELVNEAIEPFRADLDRRAALGLLDAAANLAVGTVAGVYRVREPEEGTVLAYAGEDTPTDLAEEFLDRAAKLGVALPDDAAESHWPGWSDLW